MKVALLSLEMTVQSHFFTPKISSGSSMSMSGAHGDLAGQTLAVTGFALADVIQLGRRDIAAAGFHPPCTDHRNRRRRRRRRRRYRCRPARRAALPPAGLVTALAGSPLMLIVTSPAVTSWTWRTE